MTARNHDDQLGEIYPTMSLAVHLALVFHVFIAVAVMVEPQIRAVGSVASKITKTQYNIRFVPGR